MFFVIAGIVCLLGSVAVAQQEADAPIGITTVWGDDIAPIGDYGVDYYDEPTYCYGEYSYGTDYSLEVPELPCFWTGNCPVEGCENKCMVDGAFPSDNFELAEKVAAKVDKTYMCSDATVVVRALQIYSQGEYYYDYTYDEQIGEYAEAPASLITMKEKKAINKKSTILEKMQANKLPAADKKSFPVLKKASHQATSKKLLQLAQDEEADGFTCPTSTDFLSIDDVLKTNFEELTAAFDFYGYDGDVVMASSADYDGDGKMDPDSYLASLQKFKDAATLEAWFEDHCVNETVTGDLVQWFMYFDDVLDYYEEFGDYAGSGGAGIAPGMTPASAPSRRLQNVAPIDSEIPESLMVCRDNEGLIEELNTYANASEVCWDKNKKHPVAQCQYWFEMADQECLNVMANYTNVPFTWADTLYATWKDLSASCAAQTQATCETAAFPGRLDAYVSALALETPLPTPRALEPAMATGPEAEGPFSDTSVTAEGSSAASAGIGATALLTVPLLAALVM